MSDFKFETSFSSKIKALIPFEKDEYLALASLDNIKDFLPDINIDRDIDLLPIAFNACVVNRVNKNGDVINTDTAISVANSFINKQINVEHNRDRVVGVILKAGYSEFGTDKPISETEVKNFKGPFNITLGGVVWRIVNPNLANLIEEHSDPTSENYHKISASWELGFDEYDIVCLEEGEKNIENGTIISAAEEVDKIKSNLRAFGGTGKMDGKNVYRQVKNRVLPLGIGLTETPAADVKGIIIPDNKKDPEINIAKNVEIEPKNCVKENSMKIEKINDINDQTWSTLSASVVSDFVADELRKASEEYVVEKSKLEASLSEAANKHASLSTEHETLKAEFEKIKAELEALVAEKNAKLSQEKFDQRFASFDVDFDLDDEDRAIIAADIKDMEDEAFAAYSKKMKKLMSNKMKKKEASKEEKKEECPMTASAKTSDSSVVEEAIEKGEAQKETVPNTIQATESLADKYKKAFSIENFEIKY